MILSKTSTQQQQLVITLYLLLDSQQFGSAGKWPAALNQEEHNELYRRYCFVMCVCSCIWPRRLAVCRPETFEKVKGEEYKVARCEMLVQTQPTVVSVFLSKHRRSNATSQLGDEGQGFHSFLPRQPSPGSINGGLLPVLQ